MIRLSKRSGRLAALFILLALIGAVIGTTLLPALSLSGSYDESIDELRFRLDKYQRMAGLEGSLKERLEQLTAQQMSGEGLLQGESTAIAGASLQELLKQGVQGAGGRLESTQILPGSTQGPMEKIAIRARFGGTIQALQKILYTFEYGKPILFIDNIEISTQRRSRRTRRGQKTTRDQLKVSLEISGYRRIGGKS